MLPLARLYLLCSFKFQKATQQPLFVGRFLRVALREKKSCSSRTPPPHLTLVAVLVPVAASPSLPIQPVLMETDASRLCFVQRCWHAKVFRNCNVSSLLHYAFSFSPRLVWDRRPRNVKKTGLSSAAEDNKRECTISHHDSALFTFKTMEGEKSFFLGELLLFT